MGLQVLLLVKVPSIVSAGCYTQPRDGNKVILRSLGARKNPSVHGISIMLYIFRIYLMYQLVFETVQNTSASKKKKKEKKAVIFLTVLALTVMMEKYGMI